MDEWDFLSPLDLVRAGAWRSSLFLTFALSLGFFEAVLWPNLRRAGVRQTDIFADVTGVRDALGEVGAREVGRSYTVHPCWLPAGIFHPKLVALHGEEPHVLVGSGNLTFGGWGANVELIEHLIPAAHPAAFADLAAFLEDLATSPRIDIGETEPLVRWAETFTRAARGAVEGPVRLLHNVQKPIADQLAEQAQALGGATAITVASPYYGGPGAVLKLAEQLGLDVVDVHVAGQLPFRGEVFPFGKAPAARPVVLEIFAQPASKAERGLHAKLIEIICARGRLLLSGSVNASRPALAETANVELGVLRIERDAEIRLSRKNRKPPQRAHLEIAAAESTPRDDILFATAVDSHISGRVLGRGVEGLWSGTLTFSQGRLFLGKVSVAPDGVFAAEADSLPTAIYATGRAVVALAREGRRAIGFLTLQDSIDLGHRLGPAIGPIMRIASGEGDDQDLAATLEWMLTHPELSLTAWRQPSPDREAQPTPTVLVDPGAETILSDSDVPAPFSPNLAGGVSLIERLMARLRAQLRDPPLAAGAGAAPRAEEHVEEEDVDENGEPPRRRPPDPIIGVFEQIWRAFRERVPSNPSDELVRLAEIGAHVALRRGAPLQLIRQWVADWTDLATTYLGVNASRATTDLAQAMVVLAAALDGGLVRGRRRLLHFAGADNARPPFEIDLSNPLVLRLVQASVGADHYWETRNAIEADRSAFDDLMTIRAAIAEGSTPPKLHILEKEPEVDRIRQFLARGAANMIVMLPVPISYCPKHGQVLPTGQQYRLKTTGLATPDCCDRVLMNLCP